MNAHHYLKQVEEKLQELAAETDAVRKTAGFQQYLDTMAKFWQYSYHNQLLIHFALPSATRVAGFKTWSSLGAGSRKAVKPSRFLLRLLGLRRTMTKRKK